MVGAGLDYRMAIHVPLGTPWQLSVSKVGLYAFLVIYILEHIFPSFLPSASSRVRPTLALGLAPVASAWP